MVNFSRQSNNAIVKWWWTIDKIILFVSLALLAIGIILDITASPAVARKIGSDDYFFIRKRKAQTKGTQIAMQMQMIMIMILVVQVSLSQNQMQKQMRMQAQMLTLT